MPSFAGSNDRHPRFPVGVLAPMTPLEAERIVNDYGAVLESTAPLVFGAPETLLPFDKDVIKQAIRVVLTFLKANPESCRKDLAKDIELLKIAYPSLANFIPAEDARIAAAANTALLSGDANHPEWGCCERGLEIVGENVARRVALADEF